jgi:hypothetical protein
VTKETAFISIVALLRSTFLLTKAHPGTRLNKSNNKIHLIESTLLLARQVERETNESQTILLDEFDRAVPQIWPSEAHYANELMHEYDIHLLKDNGNGYSTVTNTSSDFLSLAISSQLILYLEAKLHQHKSIIRDKQGMPYLSYSLTFSLNQAKKVNKKVVELLLSHGSNPNDSYFGHTPWITALSSVLGYHYNGWLSDSESRDWIYIFKLLLEHGADVNVKVRSRPYIGVRTLLGVSQVIETCFSDLFSEERAELLAFVQTIHKEGQKGPLQATQEGPHESPTQKRKPSTISRSKLWLEKKLLRPKK